MNDNQEAEAWETVGVEAAKPVHAVISVRFPPELAERVFAEAERQGVRTSAIVREAVEAFLETSGTARANTSDLTISTREGTQVTLYNGRSSVARTSPAPSEFTELVASGQ